MPIAHPDALEQMIEDRIVATPGIAPSIYDRRLGDPDNFPDHQDVPHCIYFFYIRVNEDGALKVDHYFYFEGPPDDPMQWAQIPYDQVAAKIELLAKNGRPSGDHDPPPLPNHNFENVQFKRKCYVAYFLDEANWAYHTRASGRYAMVYNQSKAGGQANHSFFDAQDISLQMSGRTGLVSTRTGVVLVNHMKGANGLPLEDGAIQKFAFDMYFDVAFADPSAQRLVVVFDPDGNNLGPPLPPP